MSSTYSFGDVSAAVEALIRQLLKKHPTLMFTASAVAKHLSNFSPEDVRRALHLEAERGLLEPFIAWYCEDCISPTTRILKESSPFDHCDTCDGVTKFEQYVYYKATDALMRHIHSDEANDLSKKAVAATDEELKSIATDSLLPQNFDHPTAAEREIIAELKNIGRHVERGVDVSEDIAASSSRSADANETTATSTTKSANDGTGREGLKYGKMAAWAAVLAIPVIIVIFLLQESHAFARITKTGEFAPSPSPSSSSISQQSTRAKSPPQTNSRTTQDHKSRGAVPTTR